MSLPLYTYTHNPCMRHWRNMQRVVLVIEMLKTRCDLAGDVNRTRANAYGSQCLKLCPRHTKQLHCKLYAAVSSCEATSASIRCGNNHNTNCIDIMLYQPLPSATAATTTQTTSRGHILISSYPHINTTVPAISLLTLNKTPETVI